jgi:hypothetical protein
LLTMQHHEENALYSLQLMAMNLEQGQRSDEDRERILFHMSRQSRIAAIAALLLRADATSFHERLQRSGGYRLQLLRERRARKRPFNNFSCTGQIAPLCDAIASGAGALAREIAALSSPVWVQRKEYEDDFHYGRLLGWFASEGEPSHAPAEPLLEELVRSTGDDTAPRVRACSALLTREPSALREALLALVEEHGARFQARAGAPGSRGDAGFETERSIFVEGLALLRLAKERGLTMEEEEYAFLPGLVWR